MAPAAEAARPEMYNELARVIGTGPADTLMTYLPAQAGESLATKADIDGLDTKMDRLEVRLDTRMDGLDTRMDRIEVRLDGLHERMDRLFLAMLTGFIGIIGAMIAGNLLG